MNILNSAFSLFLVLIVQVTINAQWRPTNGPGGGSVNDIQKFGNRLFIGTGDADNESIFAGGIFSSDDNGQTWVLRHNGLLNCRATALIEHNGKIYAGTTSGIFISADNGNSWSISNSGLANNRVKCLAVKDNILFAGMDGSGLHKSMDNGLTWTNVFNFTSVNKIVVDGNSIYVLGPGDGAFRKSTDNGVNWTTYGTANGILGSSSNSMVRRGNELFLSTFDQGIYKSVNGGENWTALQNELNGPTYLGIFGDTLWCANSIGQLQYSLDGASSWINWPEVLATAAPVAMLKNGESLFFASTKGLFQIIGNQSSKMIASIANGNIRKISSNQNRIFAGTNTGIFYSDDGCQTWIRSYFNQQDGVYSIVNYQGVIVAGTLALGTMKSDDNGNTWVRTGYSLPTGRVNGLLQTGTKLLATVRLNGLYKSSDTGKTWTKITAFPTSSTISICKISASNGQNDVLFIGGANNRTYRSINEGESWTECTIETNPAGGASSKELFGVVRVGNILYGNSVYHLYSSSDDGINWNIIQYPPFMVSNCALMADSNQILIAGGSTISRYSTVSGNWLVDTINLSSLNGSTFASMPPTGRLSGIYKINEKKYLATEGLGLWQLGFTPNRTNEPINSLPKLLCVFPNPGSSKFYFRNEHDIPAGSQLKIFNAAGRNVKSIEIGFTPAGNHMEWNAEGINYGLFFYLFDGPGFSESGRILIQ